jgi:acetyl-CoA synthetase (ADP-forming)
MDDALRVLKAALDYGTALHAPPAAPAAPPGFDPAACRAAAPRSGHFTEPEAKALLAAAGIATLPEWLATSADMAVAAAQALGYPVVLKAVCRGLVHKSDVGAVALGLGDESAVRTAWRNIGQRVVWALPAAALEGCLVAPMAANGVELIVGAKWDAQFGPVVMVGAGGVLVELLRDVQVALAPVTPATARALLERLRAWPLLAGTRGRIPADVDALVNVMVRVGWLAATLGPRLVELDINPLLVRNAGDGVVALDARATFAAELQ